MSNLIATIHRNYLPQDILKVKSTLPIDIKMIETFFNEVEFLPRAKAEKNFEFKQIIPYVIIENEFNQVAAYRRKGNESRLHDLWSIGFGGHIEYSDIDNEFNIKTLKKAAIRELNEEFSDKINYKLIFKGVINEEITEVGKNHLGFVFHTVLEKNDYIKSIEIGNIEWISKTNQIDSKFELWSQMALELISN